MSRRSFPSLLLFAILAFLVGQSLSKPFGTVNYFDQHGFLLLLGLAIFPRLTLLFSSIATGGFIWWASWLFMPRLLIAVLATYAYGLTNPVLVLLSWLMALAGESYEKHRAKVIRIRRPTSKPPPPSSKTSEKVIEAEFKRL